MSRTLEIQILIYMIIACLITFVIGYRKGHKDGIIIGRIRARKHLRAGVK